VINKRERTVGVPQADLELYGTAWGSGRYLDACQLLICRSKASQRRDSRAKIKLIAMRIKAHEKPAACRLRSREDRRKSNLTDARQPASKLARDEPTMLTESRCQVARDSAKQPRPGDQFEHKTEPRRHVRGRPDESPRGCISRSSSREPLAGTNDDNGCRHDKMLDLLVATERVLQHFGCTI